MGSWQRAVIRTFLRMSKQTTDWGAPIAGQRRVTEMGRWVTRVPKGTTVTSVQMGTVAGEWVMPAVTANDSQCLLYFHGGGYATGSCASHRALVAHVAQASGCRALSVAYGLAPERPFPAAIEDGIQAYHWLLATGVAPEEIIFLGDSAGAGLVLAILLALRDGGESMPAGAVCLSPMADMTGSGDSIRERADLDPWFVPEMLVMLQHYVADNDPKNPLLSPVFADLTGLPPLLFHVGTDEILHSDTMRLLAKAEVAGVAVTVREWAGMWHAFHYFVPFVPEARAAVTAVGTWVQAQFE